MDFIDDELFASITGCIDAQLGPEFSFVDVGGGIGGFTDRLLAAYPGARGVVLDNAPALLDKNERSDRKTLVLAGAEELDRIFGAERFDIVFLNYALHHFVLPSYGATRRLQRSVLSASRGLLTERGAVSLCENMANGRYLPNLPGRLVFGMTSLRALAPLVRRLGANTAGTGVCFNARSTWYADLADAGFAVDHYSERSWSGQLSTLKRTLLTIDRWTGAHVWATPLSTARSRGGTSDGRTISTSRADRP